MLQSEELGYDLDPSDDSADEYDDDNLEDNDMSSDNETLTNTASLPPKPPLPSQCVPAPGSSLPEAAEVVKMDISDSTDNKSHVMPIMKDRKPGRLFAIVNACSPTMCTCTLTDR